MTASDREIAERVIARLRRILATEGATQAAAIEPSAEGGMAQ